MVVLLTGTSKTYCRYIAPPPHKMPGSPFSQPRRGEASGNIIYKYGNYMNNKQYGVERFASDACLHKQSCEEEVYFCRGRESLHVRKYLLDIDVEYKYRIHTHTLSLHIIILVYVLRPTWLKGSSSRF